MRVLPITRLTHGEMAVIKEAVEYINVHFSEKICAEDLCDRFSITARKLQAGFHKQTGYTVHNYLSNVRLLNAKLLLSGDEPIKIIAEKTGYSNQSHFGEFFKNHTGMTPAEYRLQQQG
jgi:AraC-like DNA-binding protein